MNDITIKEKSMLDVLSRWNRWGGAELPAGIEREVTKQLQAFFYSSEIVALIGPRRAGKTTILFQVMDMLENSGIPQAAMLHINLEEPALSPRLNVDLLDQLYDAYRENIYPQGKAYIFLDEIQNIPNWERWIRARNETEDVKFFITGSSSQLMSRELGTVLTGRHISFQVFPLNFREFLQFKNISLPTKNLKSSSPPPTIQHALNAYLKWGGFPEIVLAENEQRKELLLKQYFDDILFKDVAMRHNIRDMFALRDLAVYLLTHTGSLISFQRIAKVFEVSLDLARSYCQYLQEAFIVDFVPFYSRKAAERQRNPHKVYAVDLGLRNAVNLTLSTDDGHILETAIYHVLQQTLNDGIFYWKKEVEVDFVIRKGTAIKNIIQVVAEAEEETKTMQREIRALKESHQAFPQANRTIIVGKMPSEQSIEDISTTPFWRYVFETNYS